MTMLSPSLMPVAPWRNSSISVVVQPLSSSTEKSRVSRPGMERNEVVMGGSGESHVQCCSWLKFLVLGKPFVDFGYAAEAERKTCREVTQRDDGGVLHPGIHTLETFGRRLAVSGH